jgi:DNA-binding NtrC family response regulator
MPAMLAAIERRFTVSHGQSPPNATPFIGEIIPVQRLRDYLFKVARSECNVLITGESGTGKELVARAVHQNSVRR